MQLEKATKEHLGYKNTNVVQKSSFLFNSNSELQKKLKNKCFIKFSSSLSCSRHSQTFCHAPQRVRSGKLDNIITECIVKFPSEEFGGTRKDSVYLFSLEYYCSLSDDLSC